MKQSLTKLGCVVSGAEFTQIELTQSFGVTEFREAIKGMMETSGVKRTPVAFTLTDAQIVDETFLEDISSMLNSGEIPNLWASDEWEKIIVSMGPVCKDLGVDETRKNLISIINAMTLMKIKAPLVVVGKKTKYMNFINIQLKKLKFDPSQIIFLHDVSVEDLPGIYQLSSLFVYPSIFEGFGIPILEALFSKTPVITTKGGCFSESGGSHSYYINPLDVNELTQAIKDIKSDKDLRERMIEKGQQHAQKFKDDKIAQNLMNIYQSL